MSSGNLKTRSRPTCACGCGIPVSFDVKNDRWYRFYDGHKEGTSKSIRIRDLIRDGETQDKLGERLGLDSKTIERAVNTLVKLKFLAKRKVVRRGRRTFELIRTEPPRFTPPVLKKKLKVMTVLERDGFVKSRGLTIRERRVITDPLLTENPATAVTIQGGAKHRGKGSTRYSTRDFFGHRITETFYVADPGKFRRRISSQLERRFLQRNPHPDRDLKKAFTRFLHDYSMHWSMCHH